MRKRSALANPQVKKLNSLLNALEREIIFFLQQKSMAAHSHVRKTAYLCKTLAKFVIIDLSDFQLFSPFLAWYNLLSSKILLQP